MAQQIADRRDVDFVLHEQLHVEELSKHDKFAEFNKKTVDLIISCLLYTSDAADELRSV